MEELKNGVIYANIAGIVDVQLTSETLLEILDAICCNVVECEEYDDEESGDDYDDNNGNDANNCQDDLKVSSNAQNDKVYAKKTDVRTKKFTYDEAISYLKDNDDVIVAFSYELPVDKSYLDDRRDYVGNCVGIYDNTSDAEWYSCVSKGSVLRIANTWNYVLKTMRDNKLPANIPAKVDECTRGQWSASDFKSEYITFCYASDVKNLIINDKYKNSFVEEFTSWIKNKTYNEKKA